MSLNRMGIFNDFQIQIPYNNIRKKINLLVNQSLRLKLINNKVIKYITYSLFSLFES
jgi:predicted lipoprotein